jgi:hypothetical protein
MKQSINSSTQKNEKSSNLKTISQENINAEKRKLEEISTNHKKSQIEQILQNEKNIFQNWKKEKNFDTLNETPFYLNAPHIQHSERK